MVQFEAKNLTFRYADPHRENQFMEERALDNISFSIQQGEFILICGKSGCGKTTLLRHLKPQLTPFGKKEGFLSYCDSPMHASKEKTVFEIGYVMQNPENQIVTDKVWHELSFGLENMGLSQEEMEQRIAEVVHFFDMNSWYEQSTHTLSGGQKQILALASVMAMGPKVLILDEATSQLDPIAAREFLAHIGRIHDEYGITIIMCEHNLEHVYAMADKVMLMEKGRIELFDDKEIVARRLYLGDLREMLPIPTQIGLTFEKEKQVAFTVKEGRNLLKRHLPSEMENCLAVDESAHVKEQKDNRETVLQAKKIWFAYDRKEKYLLKELSLTLYKGECVCVLGANGCGKTTLLQVLADLRRCVQGKIIFDKHTKIACLHQDPQCLFAKETVQECLSQCMAYEKDGEAVVNKLALSKLLKRHPYDLSGGEQQRLAFAMLLLQNADILLLDEPTKGLDALFCDKLAKWFMELKAQGKTIVLVTHDVEFAAKVADRCAILFEGSLVAVKNTKSFFRGNQIYTTSAGRLCRGILKEALTKDELLELISKNKDMEDETE